MLNSERSELRSPEARFVEPAIALLVFLASLAWFQRTLHLTVELRDEGYLLYNIARAAGGAIPHRDFIEGYGPGVYALTAPVFGLFGEQAMAVRVLLALVRASAVTLAYLIARRLAPRPFALLGASFALGFWGWSIWNLVTPYAALLTIPLCMLAAFLLLVGMSSGRRSFYFWAGLVCGFALLFKWTLAAVTVYGLVLAIVAAAMLESRSAEGPGGGRGVILVAWGLAGALILAPFTSMLSGYDYLLHIAPIHLLVLSIAVAFQRAGDGRVAFERALPLVVRVCVGFAIAPVLVALLYWSWGSLGALLHDVVTRPMGLRNYYASVRFPAFASVSLLAGVVLGVAAGLALLRRRSLVALACGGGAAILLAYARYSLPPSAGLLSAYGALFLLLPALTAYATLACVAGSLRTGTRDGAAFATTGLVAALFFQEMMTFQVFPRAGPNSTLMLGALGPLVAYLAHRGYGLAMGPANDASRMRSLAAFALVALVPALLVSRQVGYALTAPRPDELPQTALSGPRLAGIHPKPELWERQDLAGFDALSSALRTAEPMQAPLFVLHNEPMIYFASERRALFEDHMMIFFLAGWGLLTENDRDMPEPASLIAELEGNPETLVVTRLGDRSLDELRAYFPELHRYIAARYAVAASFGEYRILRRASR